MNDDAREQSSVTGKALGIAAAAGVGLGATGLAVFGGKRAISKLGPKVGKKLDVTKGFRKSVAEAGDISEHVAKDLMREEAENANKILKTTPKSNYGEGTKAGKSSSATITRKEIEEQIKKDEILRNTPNKPGSAGFVGPLPKGVDVHDKNFVGPLNETQQQIKDYKHGNPVRKTVPTYTDPKEALEKWRNKQNII